MNYEIIDHIKAMHVGPRNIPLVEELTRCVPNDANIMNKDTGVILFSSPIDKQVVHMMEGAIYGLYLEMRHEGGEPIAKQILKEEGLPQKLTGDQKKYLHTIDNLIKKQ